MSGFLVSGTTVTISVVEAAAIRRKRSRNEQKAVVKVALPAAKVNAHSHGVSMRIEAGR